MTNRTQKSGQRTAICHFSFVVSFSALPTGQGLDAAVELRRLLRKTTISLEDLGQAVAPAGPRFQRRQICVGGQGRALPGGKEQRPGQLIGPGTAADPCPPDRQPWLPAAPARRGFRAGASAL